MSRVWWREADRPAPSLVAQHRNRVPTFVADSETVTNTRNGFSTVCCCVLCDRRAWTPPVVALRSD